MCDGSGRNHLKEVKDLHLRVKILRKVKMVVKTTMISM